MSRGDFPNFCPCINWIAVVPCFLNPLFLMDEKGNALSVLWAFLKIGKKIRVDFLVAKEKYIYKCIHSYCAVKAVIVNFGLFVGTSPYPFK